MTLNLIALGEIADFINGFAFKPSHWSGRGKKIIRIQNLTAPEKPFNRTSLEVDERYVVRKGDILVSWSATLDVFTWTDEDALLNQHIFKVVPDLNLINLKYFKYALKAIIDSLGKYTRGSTMKHINRGDFLATKIPLPSLSIQKQIAEILEKADQLRKDCQQMEKELNSLAKAVFIDMFGDPVSNPKGWKVKPLEKLIEKGDRINYGVVQPGEFQSREEGIPLIRISDFSKGGISLDEIKHISKKVESKYKRSRIVGDEILIACVGATIGKVARVSKEMKGFNIARAVTRVRVSNDLDPYFLQKYLESDFVQSFFIKETRSVGQPTLNTSLIAKTPILIPNKETSERFIKFSQENDNQIKIVQGLEKQFDIQFDALMLKAFSGELNLKHKAA